MVNIDLSTVLSIGGIVLTVVGILISIFISTKKNSISVSQENSGGNANMNNNTIANEIYTDKKGREK